MTRSPVEWTAEILRVGEEVLLPVKALWLDMQSKGIGFGLTVDAYATMLEIDGRFEFFQGIDVGEEDDEQSSLMEDLGLCGGLRVKLASRALTSDHVARMLRQSMLSMLEALEGAWEVRPPDDPEAEAELLEVLTMAERLKHEVDCALRKAEEEGEPGA